MKKTTLKWNCLFAAVAIGGVVAATSCVKNEESDSVKAIREAQVSKVSADAAYRQAEAALKQAEAAAEAVETKIQEVVLKQKEALSDATVEKEKEALKQQLLSSQSQIVIATTSLVNAKKALADAEAVANANNPKLTAWQGLYEKLYGTTFGNSGLYADLAELVGDLNDKRVEIITANFSKSSATETLREKDSIAAKKELDYQQNLLSIYEAVAGKTVVIDDTVKVQSKKSTITAEEWATLKSILGTTPNAAAAVDSRIGLLKSIVATQITSYDNAVRLLAAYRAGLYGTAESLKALEQEATKYEARIELVKSEIADIEKRMAELLK